MVVVDFESTYVGVSYALASVDLDGSVDRLRSYFGAEKASSAIVLIVCICCDVNVSTPGCAFYTWLTGRFTGHFLPTYAFHFL